MAATDRITGTAAATLGPGGGTPGERECALAAEIGQRVLLVHHARLDRWLLPGGHVEPEDGCVEDAARREVIEETGVALGGGGAQLSGHRLTIYRKQPNGRWLLARDAHTLCPVEELRS